MNIDVSDFIEWADEEIEKERQSNGELTGMGRGILRIKTLILNRLEEKRNGERSSENPE